MHTVPMGTSTRAARAAVAAALAASLFSSCSILRAASKVETVFMREEDPAIAADAFPILIKASEILLEGSP
ncbi:MAG: hypothetical protein Q8M76_19545, partial [Spirochaetaceae bacterium]|nr:hypothetical protein [Spirochaetaceae bacterium]